MTLTGYDLSMGPENPTAAERRRLHALRTGEAPSGEFRDLAPAAGVTLTGYDLSSHNTPAQVTDALGLDFVIVKASEGATYVNPTHDSWVNMARAAHRLVGHYHYARPESNGPDTEARAFLRAANAQPGDVVVLDFEPPQILPVYPAWALGFADVVTAVTGAPCWLYTNQSQGRALMSLATPEQRVQLALMPLWKAYYQSTVGDLMGWPTWACWQKTSTPIDTNVFNGTPDDWRQLGVPMADVTLSTATIAALAKALAPLVADEVYARRFGKIGSADTTSLGDFLVWSEPIAIREADRVVKAVNAIPAPPAAPVPPSAEDIAAEVWKPVRGA